MRLKALLYVVAIAIVVVSSYYLSRGEPRTFTVAARQISLPRALETFDNASRVVELRATLNDAASSSPCPLAVEAGKSEPSCKLEPIDGGEISLVSSTGEGAFDSIDLGDAAACALTLRADSVDQGPIPVRLGRPCSAQLTLLIVSKPDAVDVRGLARKGERLSKLGHATQPTKIAFTPSPSRSIEMRVSRPAGELPRMPLWLDPVVGLDVVGLTLSPIHAEAFTHKVGSLDVMSKTCEVGPEKEVSFAATRETPLKLTSLVLTPDGVEASFGATTGWTLTAGSCGISSSALEWWLFLILTVGGLVALGLLKWIL